MRIVTNGTYAERDRSMLEFVLRWPVMALEAKVRFIDYRLKFVVWLVNNLVTVFAILLGSRSVYELAENSCSMTCSAYAATFDLLRRTAGGSAKEIV